MASSTIDVADDKPEAALFNDLAANPAIGIGDTAAVGTTGEFARIAGGAFQQGGGQNDLLFLMQEVLYGDGVEGVALNTIDDDSIVLELTNAAGVADTVAFDGVGGVVQALSLGFVDAGNALREFALFDLAEGDAIVVGNTAAVGATGEFAGIVGGAVEPGDLEALFGAVLEGGVDGVALNTLDDDTVTLELTNAAGVTDTVTFDNAGGYLADIYHG